MCNGATLRLLGIELGPFSCSLDRLRLVLLYSKLASVAVQRHIEPSNSTYLPLLGDGFVERILRVWSTEQCLYAE